MKHIRTWRDPDGSGFRLEMYDTGDTDQYGKWVVKYDFYHRDRPVFTDQHLHVPPMAGFAIDSDFTAANALAFTSLRLGDTDEEFFADYTPVQLAWAEEWGETLSLYAEDLENPVRYYRHPASGDYLAVQPNRTRRDDDGQRLYDGRGTAVEGLVTSVCSCTVGETYLHECEPVEKGDVPQEWLDAIGL